jgi:hypothetical protein
VVLLYRDYKQSEAARRLGIEKPQMEKAMRCIRRALADWSPDTQRSLGDVAQLPSRSTPDLARDAA